MAASNDRDKKLRDELNSLLSGVSDLQAAVPSPLTAPSSVNLTKDEAKGQTNILEFDEMDKKFKQQARTFIDSMHGFYLDFGVIDKPDYLHKKAMVDTMDLSSIFTQLKLTKTVMNKIVDEIMRGSVNPKLIESFSTINAQYSEIIKMQVNYVLFLEESCKKSRMESANYNTGKGYGGSGTHSTASEIHDVISDSDSDFFITADPTKLIEEVRVNSALSYDEARQHRSEYLKNTSDSKALVDPTNKGVLLELSGVDTSTIDRDDDGDHHVDLLDMI